MTYSQDTSILDIDIAHQKLVLKRSGQGERVFSISTALNGPGEENGSGCTPTGWHTIRAKIGNDAPLGAVFVGRRQTGEIYTTELGAQYPKRDWILTRIIWLSGLEVGRNRLGKVDTMRRFIYIHGCPDECSMGVPLSHGCIRMCNADIVDLYSEVTAGDRVYIHQ